MEIALGCLAAYLLGGIPFGLVLVRLFKGLDIRTLGSGNVGATNASRAFGARLKIPVFLLIYVLDFAKGFVPAQFGPELLTCPQCGVWLGASAIAGHCWSPYLRLKGGKGVATTTGVMAALELVPLLIALAAFFAVLGITRRVFLGSLALGLALAASIILRDPATAFSDRAAVSIFGLAVAGFLFFTHRANIASMRSPSTCS